MDDGAVPGPSKSPHKPKEKAKHPPEEESSGHRKVQAKKSTDKKQIPGSPQSKSEDSNMEGRVVDVSKCRLGLIIGNQIGSGSFAKVYKAYSCQKEKDVAVKIFKRSDIPENYFNKFIVREIEVIKELRHPNLVKFYDCQFTTKR